jgi:hypothetical protein
MHGSDERSPHRILDEADLFICDVENYSNIEHFCCELIINVSNFGYN